MKRIMFAATTSGTGKTTISCGIMRALRNRGLKVQPFKVGPDYIDPEYHRAASGVKSRNLDEFMLPPEEIRYLFSKAAERSDIGIIEGVMGVYDGLGASFDYCSTASMSKILDCPVVLIIDGRSMAASAAALVLGFKSLDKALNIVGVIANNVSTDSHFDIIKKSVESYAGVPVIGRIPKDTEFALSSRHLGLTPSVETEGLDEKLEYIAAVIEKHIDLELLLKLAESRPVEYDLHRRDPVGNITDVRLAVANDKAFNFYYQDALELLEDMGVELMSFSPMNDERLPEHIDGIFIGGGFPEIFARELSENEAMLAQIRQKSEDGMPIYGECGGLMYLGEALQDLENNFWPMTRILPGKSVMAKKLQRFGYCIGRAEEETPISLCGEQVKGHEFHYSDFVSDLQTVYRMEKNMTNGSLKVWGGGYLVGNTLGTYLHTHFAGDYQLALRLIRKMEAYRAVKKEND